jgi:hypothetical protein
MSDPVDDQEWPEGFFERVVGGWQGEPLERPDQGRFESSATDFNLLDEEVGPQT